jgi:exodeoxyribonuclease V beta subunit
MNSLDPLTLPLQGKNLIDASAGTGKTYTIAALYVRLILEKTLTPKDILVVTFTEAATEELRERIRSRLSESAQYFRGQIATKDSKDFLERLRSSYNKTQWSMCARNLDVAANAMDEAAVFTIHSWCNRMLQQHAFDSGSPFKQNVNTEDTELLNNVIRDYWRVHFYGLDESQCAFIVKKVAKSPNDFAEKIKGLLKETEALPLDKDIELVDIYQVFAKWIKTKLNLETIAKDCWKNDSKGILKLFENAKETKNKKKGEETVYWLNQGSYPKDEMKSRLDEIDQWAKNKATVEVATIEKYSFLKLENALKNDYKKEHTKFSFSAFTAIDNLVDHCRIENKIVKNIKQHAIKWIRNRYAEEKKKISRVTFEDMLSNLDNALQGKNAEQLGKVIRTQYPVALIDEFQDTDPIQYRIFSKIYHNESSSCFLIGDPKQAIYSFRGADIYTYLDAHKDTKKENRHTLKKNFRSTEAFVTAVNQLFQQAEDREEKGAFLFGDAEENPLPFVSVDAAGRKDDLYINNEIAPALTFWKLETDLISIGDYREYMAKVTASEIVKLLNDKKVGFKGEEKKFEKLDLKDIAILVKDGKEAKIIRRELNNRKLKSVYLSEKDSIYDTDEAPDVLIWLKAMANPRDEGKVRAAVSTGTLGFDKYDLYSLTLDDVQWDTHLNCFQNYQTRWQKSGILPALRLLIHDYGLHPSSNNANESERKLTNILHLAELLQQHSSKIKGEEALIHHFAQLLESKDYRSGNNSIIRLESDANLIKIITIHKSKGLEYPLVFLPFVSDAKVVDGNSRYYKYHDHSGVHIDLDKNPANQALNEKERLQEDLRLIYVAVTRAKYACWLGIAPTTRKKTPILEKTAIGHLLGWKEDKKDKKGKEASISNKLALLLEEVKGECSSIEIVALPAKLPEESNALFSRKKETDSTKKEPRKSKLSKWESWWTGSYSVLKFDYKNKIGEMPEIETAEDNDDDDDDTEFLVETSVNSGVHGLPTGRKPGISIHELLEKCGDYGFEKAHGDQEWREKTIKEILADNLWNDEKRKVIGNVLPTWLEMPLVEEAANSRFIDLDKSNYKSEFKFLIGAESVNVSSSNTKVATLDKLIAEATLGNETRPALKETELNGFLTGSIDLIFCHNKKYYIVDYKFNHLGNSFQDYSPDKIKKVMLEKRYDVQYSLYLLALHRLLKTRLGDDYNYAKHFGGAIYVFLRGNALRGNAKFSDTPSRNFIESLDKLFGGK